MAKLLQIISFFVMFGFSYAVYADNPTIVWDEKTDHIKLVKTKDDLQILKGNQLIISFKAQAEQRWRKIVEEIQKDEKEDGKSMQDELILGDTILSLVGHYVSYEESAWNDKQGAAHPSDNLSYSTIDVSKIAAEHLAKIKLTDIFPEKEILAALLKDKIVQQALVDTKQDNITWTSPEALLKALNFKSVTVGGCHYLLQEDLLSRFSFHHIEGDNIAVRLYLPYDEQLCRGRSAEIGILLPLNHSLPGTIGSDKTEWLLVKTKLAYKLRSFNADFNH